MKNLNISELDTRGASEGKSRYAGGGREGREWYSRSHKARRREWLIVSYLPKGPRKQDPKATFGFVPKFLWRWGEGGRFVRGWRTHRRGARGDSMPIQLVREALPRRCEESSKGIQDQGDGG